ncbi:MAG TPA: universal stress protein [Caulobacteraceae bacterium]|jgi:nucleotide-binding universal stress UspA family protein|nr:universal stress protein [Caulobacteraceae bacterium]
MTLRTVLVQVEPEESRLDRLRCAISVAQLFDAQLLGVGIAMLDEFLQPAVRYMRPPVLRALREEIRQNLARSADLFRRAAAPLSDRALWREVEGPPLATLCQSAARADLVIADHPGKTNPIACPNLGALIMAAGTPVLVVPPGCDRLAARNVLVGWKNTREARRAVNDSLPFLKCAERVVLVAAVEGGGERDLAAELGDVAARLERHGVSVEVERRDDAGPPADILIDLARSTGAGLIVCGAYGHSRVQEWVFGGVTDALLHRSPVPVLFSR